MSVYSIALFVHIVGAVLLFVLLTIEGVGLRVGFSSAPVNRVLGPISAVTILVPGFYMVAVQGAWSGWNVVGLLSYVLVAVLGAYTGISLMRGRMSSRAATVSWLARVGIAVGVIFDMTVKPDLIMAIAAVVVGAALGLIASLATRPEVRTA